MTDADTIADLRKALAEYQQWYPDTTLNYRLLRRLGALSAPCESSAVKHGIYRIYWGGFIPTQLNQRLVGTVCAWPVDWAEDPAAERRYFYRAVGGRGEGEYQPGSHFDIRPREGVADYTQAEWREHPDGLLRRAQVEIELAAAQLQHWLMDVDAGRPVPQAPRIRTVVVLADDEKELP